MTDKEKIREEVERLKSNLIHGACSSQVAMETRCKEEAYNEVLDLVDTMQEEPVSEFPNTESMIESYKQRLISQANGMKNSPLVDMCLVSYKHGINETLDTLNLSNVERTVKEWKEEPVSDDLEEASKEWLRPQLDKSYANYGETKMMELTHFDGYAMLDAIEFGAKWQKEQDQSTIELAEDHAMLAGMEKMKEQMLKEPNLSGYVARDEDGNLHIFEVEPRRMEEKHRWWDRDYNCHIIDNDAFPDLRWKDEPICVKLIIIKED
jgi:hypothetical protein